MYNNSYMKMGRYNRIAHFTFNGAMIDELSNHIEYVAKLRKIADIAFTNSSQHFTVVGNSFAYPTVQVNLESAAAMNFELAVIWFEGSWPLSEEFEENLLDVYDNVWSNTDWLAAGHIIDKRPDTDMPSFDPQCVVINLQAWNNLEDNFLGVNNPGIYTPLYESSHVHIHDDYTPLHLAPVGGYDDTERESGPGPLDSLISMALANNMYVHNLPYEVRDEKYCCYPADDIEETIEWLLDTKLSTRPAPDIMDIQDNMPEDKEELFGYKFMDEIVLYVTNTEAVPPRGSTEYDHTVMTCPCSGLHQFMHMINARGTLETVIWTDFCDAALWWVELLVTKWDGTDFMGFYEANKQYIHDTYDIHDDTIIFDESLVDTFMAEAGDSWLDDWAHIQSLDHTFMKINLVTEWEKLVNMIGNDNKVFMQVSNIWQYEINYVNTENCQAQLAYINLMHGVLRNNTELHVTGDTPSGIYYSYQNMKEITSIF